MFAFAGTQNAQNYQKAIASNAKHNVICCFYFDIMSKFRGKVIQRVSRFPEKYHDFGFVYGWHYCHYNGDFSSMIVEESKDFEDFKTYDVVHYTVTQCIGLIDKNGKELYQKDIIKYVSENDGESVFITEVDASLMNGIIINNDSLNLEFSLYGYSLSNGNFEIIGNSFDNKELLK